MEETYNIYCDETNHLEHSPVKLMGLGAVWCSLEEVKDINERIREIKKRHNLSPDFEIKWTKVSPAKLSFYQDIIDYFFDNEKLHFRVVVINKDILDHEKFNQSHDDFYYKMYYELLRVIIPAKGEFNIYVDIKDTRSQEKISKLHEVMCNYLHDYLVILTNVKNRFYLVSAYFINYPHRKEQLIQERDIFLQCKNRP